MNSKIKISHIKYMVMLAICILYNNTANAIPLMFDYEGQVETIMSDETGQIADADIKTGIRFFGSFSYDSDSGLTSTFNNGADFSGISISVEFESGASATSAGEPVVQIYNDNPSFDDGINIVAGPSGSNSSYFDYDIHLQIQILLLDSSGVTFSSLELPSSIKFDDFTRREFIFSGRDSGGFDRFSGKILSVEQRYEAPEPNTLFLMVVGLIVIFLSTSIKKHKIVVATNI